MSASPLLNSQQSAGLGQCTLAAGAAARSLRGAAAMRLCVLSGRAWVTLGDGRRGWRADGGDLVLESGQSLCVARGQRVVIEPLGRQDLHYQWRRPGAVQPVCRPAADMARGVCRA